MEDIRLGMVEVRFANLIWANEPLTTKALVKLCEKELHWKRTTTYTVLKKLCDRGIFTMQDSTVTALLSKNQFHAIRTEAFVEENFQGSLPAFLAAFTSRNTLSPDELAQIRKLMDDYAQS